MGYRPITDLYTIVDTSSKEHVEKADSKNVTNESNINIIKEITWSNKVWGFYGKGVQEIREKPLKGESIKPVKSNMVNDNMKLSILNSYDSKYSWIQRK